MSPSKVLNTENEAVRENGNFLSISPVSLQEANTSWKHAHIYLSMTFESLSDSSNSRLPLHHSCHEGRSPRRRKGFGNILCRTGCSRHGGYAGERARAGEQLLYPLSLSSTLPVPRGTFFEGKRSIQEYRIFPQFVTCFAHGLLGILQLWKSVHFVWH